MASSYCDSSGLLHPHLMETSYIVEYLKHRQLAIPNIEQKSRDELLKIFHNYAMPLAQRSSTRTKNINQQMDAVELTIVHPPATNNKPASKHKLIVYESNPEQNTSNSFKSISSVTNGCKRMKIGTSGISETKRAHQDIKVDCSVTQKTKRQKITWP